MTIGGGRRITAVLVLVVLALFTPSTFSGAHAEENVRPVIVVGMSGVQWDDVSADTPTFSSLLDHGAAGNLVSRSVTSTSCALDGWLAMSAGKRAAAARSNGCQPPAEPSSDGVVAGWSDHEKAIADQSYDAELGTLGDKLSEAGIAAAAAGPGAAVALAGADGRVVGEYAGPTADADALAETLPALFDDHELSVVDLGAADATDGPTHQQQVADFDERLGVVLAEAKKVSPDAVVMVVSLADASSTPGLQLAWLSDEDTPSALVSSSTRQGGLVQATDLTPTVLDLLGIEVPSDLAGSPIRATDGAIGQRALVDQADHSAAVLSIVGFLYAALVVLNLGLIALVTWWWRSGRIPDRGHRLLPGACALLGAVPAASFAANAVPWWRSPLPGASYAAAVVVLAIAIAALAYAGPWRVSRWGPPVGVAVVSAGVLCADVTGLFQFQLAAPMGISPLVGGRFYGFGNSAFVLWATALLFIAAAATDHFVRRGRRRAAASWVAALGVVCVVIDGTPAFGADFGGPPATLPAFAILALLVLGVRLTWRRSLVVLAVCAVVALSISVIDWLRPPSERTHLGRFVESVLSGDLGATLGRKVGQNLSNLFGSELTLLAIGGALFLFFVIAHDTARSRTLEPRADVDASEQLKSLLIALAVCWGIAFVVNDSGVLLPAVGMMFAVPLLIGMWSRQPQPARRLKTEAIE